MGCNALDRTRALARRWRLAACLAVLLGLWVPAGAAAQRAADEAELRARIDRLIVQLDDDKFQTRENAQKELLEIGGAAAEKLAIAAKDISLERSQRAAKLLREIRRSDLGLRHVMTLEAAELGGAVNLVLSPDGKFLYAPGWRAKSISIFRRDEVTGGLARHGTLFDRDRLAGVVHVRLSPDGKLAVATSFSSKSVCLFSRNAENGSLTLLSTRTPDAAAPMEWPTDSVFSTDSRFVYTVDDSSSAVFVFQVVDGKRLDFVERFEGRDGCLVGTRGIAVHPNGKTVLATATRARTLCVLDRDPATGRLAVRQVLTNGRDGVKGLAGAVGIECSPDGKFVYTTSGRFNGDQAVGAWKVAPDGSLTVLQEFLNDAGDLRDFTGGNDLRLSPDGRQLYASGTTSCGLACFGRDPATGKLEYLTTLRNEATGLGSQLGANGLACSSDNRFVYLALEDAGAISVFERTLP
jgi:6-phosphogluconolactonase (cycloisomerase 2 family)